MTDPRTGPPNAPANDPLNDPAAGAVPEPPADPVSGPVSGPVSESPADPVAGPVVPRDRPPGAGRPAAADRAAGDEWWPLPDPPASGGSRRVDTDVDDVERDLVRLVLTVVELLRQLMERQAMRKVDEGRLTEDQEERIGLTLMLLEDRMEHLRVHFGLTPSDLNLDLGPLGTLLPRS